MSQYSEEIERRRTFAIISHPDAGKSRLTGIRVADNSKRSSSLNLF